MASIHVCPLSKLDSVLADCGAEWVATLIGVDASASRPQSIVEDRHLVLRMSDISIARDGHVLPDELHVRALLDFVDRWDRRSPLLMHCFAGVSRSTAAAFVAACSLMPDHSETDIAQALRLASPSASPNMRIVELGDLLLGRNGRMIAAIAQVGRGVDCFEGVPFRLELD